MLSALFGSRQGGSSSNNVTIVSRSSFFLFSRPIVYLLIFTTEVVSGHVFFLFGVFDLKLINLGGRMTQLVRA